jgi:DNA-binding HxlR family transcriptional regulator
VERRRYGQFCGLAIGLDVLGERWTLLIIREFMLGPARFNDLLENLPGIGPNMLSARLRTLAEAGVIEQHRVDSDGRGRAYALTALGDELREPVLHLARWGLHLVTEEDAEDAVVRPAWALLAVEAIVHDKVLPSHVTEQYEFRVDDEDFHIDVQEGLPSVRRGPASDAAMSMTTDSETFVRIGAELLRPLNAIISGKITVQGSPEAFERCADLMGISTPVPARLGRIASRSVTALGRVRTVLPGVRRS